MALPDAQGGSGAFKRKTRSSDRSDGEQEGHAEDSTRKVSTGRTTAGNTLCSVNTEHGMEILKINNEKIAQKAGYQSPVDNVQYMMTKSRLDGSGDAVSPYGVFTNSMDHHHAQLFHTIPPNTAIGLRMSVRIPV